MMISCCQHGFPWLSLAIRLYHPLLLAGLLDCILCPCRAVGDKFYFVFQHLHVLVKGSIEEPPNFSSRVPLVLFIIYINGGVMVSKLDSKLTWVSSNLIGCPIHSALCYIEAKSFVNYNIYIYIYKYICVCVCVCVLNCIEYRFITLI